MLKPKRLMFRVRLFFPSLSHVLVRNLVAVCVEFRSLTVLANFGSLGLGLQRKGLIRKAPPLMVQKLQSLQQVQQAPSILTYFYMISHVSASTVFHVFPCIASFDVCWERHADVQYLLLHYFHSWREFVKIGKTTEQLILHLVGSFMCI